MGIKMKNGKFLVCLLLVALANCDVLELTKDNFNTTVAENEHTLVMYYDPFNTACKKFLPKFENLSKTEEGITFAKLDGEKEVETADEQGVDDYPSFELFVYGVPIKYYKRESVSGLREWIRKKQEVKPAAITAFSEITEKDYELFFVAAEESMTTLLMFSKELSIPLSSKNGLLPLSTPKSANLVRGLFIGLMRKDFRLSFCFTRTIPLLNGFLSSKKLHPKLKESRSLSLPMLQKPLSKNLPRTMASLNSLKCFSSSLILLPEDIFAKRS